MRIDHVQLAGHLADAGIKVRWDEAIPGQRRFYVADPFGNRLEVLAASSQGASLVERRSLSLRRATAPRRCG